MTTFNLGSICRIYIGQNIARLLEEEVFKANNIREICGLLGGEIKDPQRALVTEATSLSNLSMSSESFAIDPHELFRKKTFFEDKQKTVLALYHSHPFGNPNPSFRDLELPKITGLLSLILTQNDSKIYAACHGLSRGRISPVEVIVSL